MTSTPFHAYYTARILESLQDDDKFIPAFASSDIKVYPYQVGAALFATRSPYRPNRLGLSSVKIEKIYDDGENGTVIEVSGADLMNNTPIYDIKPYIPYTDCHIDAVGGFSEDVFFDDLEVFIPSDIAGNLPQNDLNDIAEILKSDPRPHYHNDQNRVYAFEYSKYHIEFKVNGKKLYIICINTIDF